MPKFALENINSIKGKQVFEKLLIDDICQLDSYETNLEKKYKNELAMIYLYMNEVANLRYPPETKYKDITPPKETVKEYEFRSKHLRIYAIKKENNKIILLGGYKNRQVRNIKEFRSIKKMFLEEKDK
jgi:hypothetical protein